MYDGTVSFQYLKSVVAMQDSTLSEIGRFSEISRAYVIVMW